MQELRTLVGAALAEDVGEGDVTTAATVDPAARAVARITQKAPGVIYGLDAAEAVFVELDPAVRVGRLVEEGVWREQGGAGDRDRGLGGGAADGRADGSELPRAPVGRGHDGGASRA